MTYYTEDGILLTGEISLDDYNLIPREVKRAGETVKTVSKRLPGGTVLITDLAVEYSDEILSYTCIPKKVAVEARFAAMQEKIEALTASVASVSARTADAEEAVAELGIMLAGQEG